MGRWNATEDPTYQPAMRVIQAITQANPAIVTTTFDHDYNEVRNKSQFNLQAIRLFKLNRMTFQCLNSRILFSFVSAPGNIEACILSCTTYPLLWLHNRAYPHQ